MALLPIEPYGHLKPYELSVVYKQFPLDKLNVITLTEALQY